MIPPPPLPEGRGISAAAWHQTPLRVRLGGLTLLKRLAALEARLPHDASNSRRPPSPEAPATKRQRRRPGAERRKPGANPGHRGHPPVLLAPTAPIALFPDACPCGPRRLADLTRDHPHQVIALPGIQPEVMPWLLSQGRCLSCGTLGTVTGPSDQGSGAGPRRTGVGGEMAGMVGASRSAGPALCC